ncbi:hypothetical protein AAY473_019108, partial [Plecturocebus cupreus]
MEDRSRTELNSTSQRSPSSARSRRKQEESSGQPKQKEGTGGLEQSSPVLSPAAQPVPAFGPSKASVAYMSVTGPTVVTAVRQHQLLRRLRQENHLFLGGKGFNERSHHCTPAWVT